MRSYKVLCPGRLLCTHLQAVGANTKREIYHHIHKYPPNKKKIMQFQFQSGCYQLSCMIALLFGCLYPMGACMIALLFGCLYPMGDDKPGAPSNSFSALRKSWPKFLFNLVHHPVSTGRERTQGRQINGAVREEDFLLSF